MGRGSGAAQHHTLPPLNLVFSYFPVASAVSDSVVWNTGRVVQVLGTFQDAGFSLEFCLVDASDSTFCERVSRKHEAWSAWCPLLCSLDVSCE